jgi:hypothetical protein
MNFEHGSPQKGNDWAASWMRASVSSRVQKEIITRNPREELSEYLSAPLEQHCSDIIRWWGVSLFLLLIILPFD